LSLQIFWHNKTAKRSLFIKDNRFLGFFVKERLLCEIIYKIISQSSCSFKNNRPWSKGRKEVVIMLSLLLPLLAGVITRLGLRPRGQGQQPMIINIPSWVLMVGWLFILPGTFWLLAEPTGGNPGAAFALIFGAGAAGLLIPEIFRGLGQAVATGLGKPRNWLWLMGIAIVLYALFVDPEIVQGIFLLGIMLLTYRIILGMFKPPKKGG
jgi:hypothetical protein